MTHRQKRIFFNWLQKHNALKKFRYNRHVFLKSSFGRGWRNMVNYSVVPVSEVLGVSFGWGDTPEGGQYWRDLETKWIHEYRNIID